MPDFPVDPSFEDTVVQPRPAAAAAAVFSLPALEQRRAA